MIIEEDLFKCMVQVYNLPSIEKKSTPIFKTKYDKGNYTRDCLIHKLTVIVDFV